jgi:hypothetical protein
MMVMYYYCIEMEEENKVDNKLLCEIFYNQDPENPDVYICCKCGNPRKKGNGWTNLSSHIFTVRLGTPS